jgi:type III secretion system YscQ/HrcQ family protein
MNAAMRSTVPVSKLRLLAQLRRLRRDEIQVVNDVLRTPPVLLRDGRIFVWQHSGPISPGGELLGRCAGAQISIAADGLAQIEPRLESVGSYLPRETLTALIEHALYPVLSMLEQASGGSIEFDDNQPEAESDVLAPRVDIGFVVYDSTLKPIVRGSMKAAAETWHLFDFARVTTLASRRYLAVPVQLAVRLGALRVPVREIAALVAGDALRTQTKVSSSSASLPVMFTDAAGRVLMRGRLTDNVLNFEEDLMGTADSVDAGAQGGVPVEGEARSEDLLGDIECDMGFELGSIRLTVADVARLRSGQAIRLGVRLQDQPVRVLVNGRLVAKGELALLGDEMVVVITDTSRLPHV